MKPGVSSALVSQVDLIASLASLTGMTLPAGYAPDSENMLPALLGDNKAGRKLLVEQAGSLALREGSWKFIPPSPGPAVESESKIELGASETPQLYDLSADLGETRNLTGQFPARVQSMAEALQLIRRRATPSR